MRAIVPPTVSSNASFAEALEEVTAGKMALILLGIGAVGGAVYYFATRPKTAAGGGAVSVATSAAASARPTPPGNTFSPSGTVQVPPGVEVVVGPGIQQMLAVMPGDSVTLTLPPGANWKGVLIGKSDNSASTPVALGGDTTSRVSIALSTLTSLGYNMIAAQWTDASGQGATAFYGVSVEQKPLTLHI